MRRARTKSWTVTYDIVSIGQLPHSKDVALTHVAMETIARPTTEDSRIKVANCSLMAIRMVTVLRSTTTFGRAGEPVERVVDGLSRIRPRETTRNRVVSVEAVR